METAQNKEGMSMAVYIRYEIENTEPLRIADDSSSHMGQTSTLHFIPGTTMRGFVINKLSRREDFSALKAILFSDKIRFLNAYPVVEESGRKIELIPSPKGFYEDKFKKKKKKLENVLADDIFTEGYKRAAVGEFAWIGPDDKKSGDDGDANAQDGNAVKPDSNPEEYVLHCMRVPTGSDLKIKINTTEDDEQTVFRNEYMSAGNTFAGYIAVEDDADVPMLVKILQGSLILGNARSSGLGKCRLCVSPAVTDTAPYSEYAADGDVTGQCYMMLLSHTAMRNHANGEYCGINTAELEEMLGVSGLEIEKCATSVVSARGYNRKWGVRIPALTMYEKGSVFKLTFSGTMTADRIAAVGNQGIGVRRNEGFGRVIFLKDYEKIRYRENIGDGPCSEDAAECGGDGRSADEILRAANEADAAKAADAVKDMYDDELTTLRAAARHYYKNLFHTSLESYIVNLGWDRGKVKPGKIAKIEAFTTAYRYDYAKAQENIEKFFAHAREKQSRERVQRYSQSDISNVDSYVTGVLGWTLADMEKALGIKTKDPTKVMGLLKEQKAGDEASGAEKGLFTEEEIGRMKLELLTRVIRFDHKKGN